MYGEAIKLESPNETLLEEAGIIDRNSEEHLQKEVNQKELPQLKKDLKKNNKKTKTVKAKFI